MLKRPREEEDRGDCAPTQKLREELLTRRQLEDIVTQALARKEAELKRYYETLLHERLEAQYQVFFKYNQDHLHSSQRNCSYLI